jgi:hypothetical protein
MVNMLPFKILTQDSFDAITLSQAKSQCRLLDSYTRDDDYITALIDVAKSVSQEYLNWMVSPGTVKQFCAKPGVVKLYGKFITEITEVTAFYGGDLVTLSEDQYSYNDVTEEVTLPDGYIYLNVTYSCGASVEQLPGSVKQGMLMLISTMYNNREDFITGLSVEKMPLTSMKLLNMSRHYVS